VKVSIPFRSTLKKLQARWIGDLQASPTGTVKLDNNLLAGTLTNQTGIDLANVYFVYHPENGSDLVLYTDAWAKNESLDLGKKFQKARVVGSSNSEVKEIRGFLNDWARDTWYPTFTNTTGYLGNNENRGDDFTDPSRLGRVTFLMMSLVDRLPPDKTTYNNSSGGGGLQHARIDIQRHGGHDLNVSAAVDAGELVILAEARDRDRPLPFPLDVNGSKVAGEGVVLYQFIVPLERPRPELPAQAQ
jgi:hypothetical protein